MGAMTELEEEIGVQEYEGKQKSKTGEVWGVYGDQPRLSRAYPHPQQCR